ncbi:hypothetical protein SGLAM104S_09052 [Streptomyces glaucescens]
MREGAHPGRIAAIPAQSRAAAAANRTRRAATQARGVPLTTPPGRVGRKSTTREPVIQEPETAETATEPEATRRDAGITESARANRGWWDRNADEYQTEHGTFLGDARRVNPASPLSAVTRFLKTPPTEDVTTSPWAGEFWKVRFWTVQWSPSIPASQDPAGSLDPSIRTFSSPYGRKVIGARTRAVGGGLEGGRRCVGARADQDRGTGGRVPHRGLQARAVPETTTVEDAAWAPAARQAEVDAARARRDGDRRRDGEGAGTAVASGAVTHGGVPFLGDGDALESPP